MSGVRQMSYGWLDKYGSDIVDGLIKLGLSGIGHPELQRMLDAGEVDLYLLSGLKSNSNKWYLRGFRLIHVGHDDVRRSDDNHGDPDIVKESKVDSTGLPLQ